MTDIYPLPAFQFTVEIEGIGASQFSEVTGLNYEAQVIEYRHGREVSGTAMKMPGLKKYGNVTLKRGVISGNEELSDWIQTTTTLDTQRKTVMITLNDEENNPLMKWTLFEAWPTKITAPDFKASGNEVAIESLELAHEGMTIAKA